ncbi:MAG: AMP-binding protein [Candidatus Omnitrophota bacterium]
MAIPGARYALNIAGVFKEKSEQYKCRSACEVKRLDKWQTITYEQLNLTIGRLVVFIKQLGIKKQDRLAIILDNRPEWVEIFFAASFVGAVVVPLNPQATPEEIKNILIDSGTSIVFISDKYCQFYPTIEGLETIRKIIILDKSNTAGKYVTFPAVSAVTSVSLTEYEPTATLDDLMVILYTSGTTAAPKGVMLTHANLLSNFNSIKKLAILREDDVILAVLPLYHAYPLMATLLVPLLLGLKVVFLPDDWPQNIRTYIKETNVTVFVGVPLIYEMLHRHISNKIKTATLLIRLYLKATLNLNVIARKMQHYLPGVGGLPACRWGIHSAFSKNLRLMICGGAKLKESIERDFLNWGFKIIQGYGLTETSPVVTFNLPDSSKIGSVGKPILDARVEIINQSVSGIGEVAVRGPNVMKGYYKKEEETRNCFKDGWFLTGDQGYLDKQGYLYLTGRLKEVIVLSSGKNIYPEEVEAYYANMPCVKEICILGMSKTEDKDNADYLYAVVVPNFDYLKNQGEFNVREVIKNRLDDLSKDLPDYRRLRGFTISRDPLPRTSLGKIKRYELRDRYIKSDDQEPRPEKELSPEEKEIFEREPGRTIVNYLRQELNIKKSLHPNDSLELDLGLDSLAMAELFAAIERIFNLEIQDLSIAASIYTLKDLIYKVKEWWLAAELTGASLPDIADTWRIHWTQIIRDPLDSDFNQRIRLNLTLADYLITGMARIILTLFFKLFYRLKVKGVENIPRDSHCILCSNHVSFYDGFLIATAIPYRKQLELFFIGFKKYFEPKPIKLLTKTMRVIPVDAPEIVHALKAAYFVLKNKKSLCIFPEGERSIDGEVKKFKKGVGILVKELNIGVIPVYLKGAYASWPRTKKFPGLHPLEVIFGKLQSAAVLEKEGFTRGEKDEYAAIAGSIQNKVTELQKQKG